MDEPTPEQKMENQRRALGIIRHGIKMGEVVSGMDAKELIWRWYMMPACMGIKMFSYEETLMEEMVRRLWPEWNGMPDGPHITSWGWITGDGILVYDEEAYAKWKSGPGAGIETLADLNAQTEKEVEKFFEDHPEDQP
jgi:hypothetical protein